MKRYKISLLLSICLILSSGFSVFADNAVYTSNTMAYIDAIPIPQYVYGGESYIVAEDLQGYGFDISWNAVTDILDITYHPEKTWTPYDANDIAPTFTKEKVAEVFSSKTKVRLNGDEIPAYSLSGRMLISMTELYRYGKVNYYPEADAVSFTSHTYISINPDWQTLLPAYALAESGRCARNAVTDTWNASVVNGLPDMLWNNTIYYVNQGHFARLRNIRSYLNDRKNHLQANTGFYYRADFSNYLSEILNLVNSLERDLNSIHGHYPSNFNNGQLGNWTCQSVDQRYDDLTENKISLYLYDPWNVQW